jgi:hypothetical protein
MLRSDRGEMAYIGNDIDYTLSRIEKRWLSSPWMVTKCAEYWQAGMPGVCTEESFGSMRIVVCNIAHGDLYIKTSKSSAVL